MPQAGEAQLLAAAVAPKEAAPSWVAEGVEVAVPAAVPESVAGLQSARFFPACPALAASPKPAPPRRQHAAPMRRPRRSGEIPGWRGIHSGNCCLASRARNRYLRKGRKYIRTCVSGICDQLPQGRNISIPVRYFFGSARFSPDGVFPAAPGTKRTRPGREPALVG